MMKKLFLLLGVLLLFYPQMAAAHIAGQPPFFKMNGKYADYYPVYTSSLPGLKLPQDRAPEPYLLHTPIMMEIDRSMLPFPPDIIDQITFTWDFGDGETGGGMLNTHTYTTAGSYVVTITADYGGYQGEFTQPVIQAVLLHVIPNRQYQLPQAIITVNEQTITDPLVDTLSFPSNTLLTFSSSSSKPGSSEISSYLWDLGEGTKGTNASMQKRFSGQQVYVFPLLRIITRDGFLSDTYVQIENTNTKSTPQQAPIPFLPLLIGVNILILLLGGLFLWKKTLQK